MVFSVPAEKIYLLSAEKEHVNTSELWPKKVLVLTPALKSQSLKVLSHDDDKQNELSLDKAKSETKWLCPVSYLYGVPYNLSG
jgi:hypothetical protein